MNCALYLLLLIGLPGGPPAGKKPASKASLALVEIKGSAVCRGRRILLRDIAGLKAADPALEKRLLDVDLGRPPAEGWLKVVDRKTVLEAIRGAGIDPASVRLAGPEETEIRSKGVLVTAEQIEEAAELVLRATAARLEKEEVEWSILRHARACRVQAGRRGVDLAAVLRHGRLERDQAVLDVSVRVDGETVKTLPVAFRLRRFRRVLVTLAPLRRGEPLDKGKVALRKMDVSRFFGTPLEDLSQVKGKVAARLLSGGAVLRPMDIKDPELVRKGDLVTMVAVRGNLRVTAKGIARTGGSMGEIVMVMNPSSRRIVQGKVVGVGVVEAVAPGGAR